MQIPPQKRNFTCNRCGRRVCSDCCRLNLSHVRVRPAQAVPAPAAAPQAVPETPEPGAVPNTQEAAEASAASEAVPSESPWSLVPDPIDEEDL